MTNRKFLVLIVGLALIFQIPVLAQSNPVSIDLLWEADTYVPDFYGGHSLISPESLVRVVAFPVVSNSQSINQVQISGLQFDWLKDGERVTSASGLAKNTLVYRASQTGTNSIGVTLSTPGGQILAVKQLSLPITNPQLIFYREDPLGGTETNRALGPKFNLAQPELTVRAEPYFFNNSAVAQGQLSYAWTVNGKRVISNTTDQSLVTFTAPSNGTGENLVELAVTNPGSLFQTAKNQLNILLNQNTVAF